MVTTVTFFVMNTMFTKFDMVMLSYASVSNRTEQV
jgi:hypothetical protein